jgi:hypothetical protein
VLRLLCYRSSARVPNYSDFNRECANLLEPFNRNEQLKALKDTLILLKRRMDMNCLPTSMERSWLMIKLILSYVDNYLDEETRKEMISLFENV